MRRISFEADLHRHARARGLALSETYEFLFRRRYNLPATDPRYLEATVEDVVVDYWAHAHLDNPKLKDDITNPDYDADVERWERALEAQAAAADAEAAAKAAAAPDEEFETVADEKWS